MKITLYSPQSSSRLSYIVDFVSKQINSDAIIITNDINAFQNADGVKINYSASFITESEIWIQPHTLLFEHTIQQQEIQCFQWNNLKAFFKTAGNFPFDIFAAAFYLLTRYEEYLPHEKDMFGRYAHSNSIAFKEGFLSLPLINLWIREFKEILLQKNPSYTPRALVFTFIPTYDIDIAYAYLHKPILNNIGGFYKPMFLADWKKTLLIRINGWMMHIKNITCILIIFFCWQKKEKAMIKIFRRTQKGCSN
jgi:hypothetical protein